jgi:hypothetical protein
MYVLRGLLGTTPLWSIIPHPPTAHTQPVYSIRAQREWVMTIATCSCNDGLTGPPLWSSGQSSWLQNGDRLSFLWGTNWIYICYAEEIRPPLWSGGQSSWLQIQRYGFDSLRYQIFWEAVSLERGPLSLVSTIEELLEENVAVSV